MRIDTFTGKRYYTLSAYYKKIFPHPVRKAAVDAGMTCPNRDGTKSTGGCAFCLARSAYFTGTGTVSQQLERELLRIRAKEPDARAIAYFQAGSNTYAPAKRLRALYDEALAAEGVCGLSVATRADCIDAEKAALLGDYAARTHVTVELGLQTVHEETSRLCGRGETVREFLDAFSLLRRAGVRVCIHLLNGLPGETEEMMLETARFAARLRPQGIKISQLHVLRGTPMAQMYFEPLTLEQAVRVTVGQLELLPAETVVERLTGDGARSEVLYPLWTCNKKRVLAEIDKRMVALNTWQGKFAPAEDRE